MTKAFKLLTISACLALLAASCSQPPDPPIEGGAPTPLPVPSPTPMPSAEVLFNVLPPSGTSPNADLELVLLDPVTGLDYNQQHIAMTALDDGRHQARLVIPVGSLVYYRYLRRDPGPAQETDTFGDSVRYRLAHVPGPTQFEDIISAWSDGAFEGETGRILGHVRSTAGEEPLPYLMVSAGGMLTFSDGEGAFRLEGLPTGVHQVTVASTDGAYLPAQQGAMIAADHTTPAEFHLVPAHKVRVTFQVTVPGDTIVGVPVRVAGNVRQLGARFGELQDGSILSTTHMPALFAVDETHFVMITEAYAGTDLRYKYTLGDGLWNAERNSQGAILTRQVIVPSSDLTIVDTVSTWHGSESSSILFRLTVPENTPAHETIGLQFNAAGWSEPLEMWRIGQHEWLYTLHSPLDLDEPMDYRYCRNMQCGDPGSPADLGPEGVQGQLTSASINEVIDDVVTAWRWWEDAAGPPSVVAPEINPREGFELGVELLPAYRPQWSALLPNAWGEITSIGSNAVLFTPGWVWEHSRPNPVLSFDPASAPYPDELLQAVADAQQVSLSVGLRATTHFGNVVPAQWWSSAPLGNDWWAVWFEEYRSFVVTLAQQASQAGVSKLVLGGPEIMPSLPGGIFPDGSPSTVPRNAETRWRDIVAAVREQFSGQLAFEIEMGSEMQSPPPFLDAFDEVHLYWHAPLGDTENIDFETLHNQATATLSHAIAVNPSLTAGPLILVAEYLSVHDGRSGCPPAPDGSCRPASDFQHGAIADPDLMVDLSAQTDTLNALLLAAYYRSDVNGFYVRGYDPTLPLNDKSASINGKPARDMLWYWFPRITGTVIDTRP